jgi:uncharacterized protein (TIGR02001 family)
MVAIRPATLALSCLFSAWPVVCPAALDAGGSLALTQDDVYRGVSLTCGHPAAQADLHLRERTTGYWAAFAGFWGSAGLSGIPCGGAREIDLYAGYSLALSPSVSGTLTYTHYAFPGGGYANPNLYGERYDYDQLGMSWSLWERLYLTLAWTPDALLIEHYGGELDVEQGRSAFAYGAEWRQPLLSWVSLTASGGYDRVADPFGTGYGFWSLGVTHVAGPLELDFAYFHTASRAVRLFGSDAAGGRVSATLVWRF